MIYYLSLGSNLGNREEYLSRAVMLLGQRAGTVERQSETLYTEPWGYESDNTFANIALRLRSEHEPQTLLEITQQIERELGRTHKSVSNRYSDRTIDIDLLQCFADDGSEVLLSTPTLTLPHPLMRERDFVMTPLKEII